MTNTQSIQTLFVAWQDYISRLWFPIGKLTFDGKKYHFVYINGAKEAQKQSNFEPLLSFPQLDKEYSSIHLFPVFANRLMSPSRPEYKNFLRELKVDENNPNFMEILALSEGKRKTDSIKLFPYPELDNENNYHLRFFVHGIRHLPNCSIERINTLKTGEELWLTPEPQNKYDYQALMLTTEDHYILGYCPRYLTDYVMDLFQQKPLSVKVKVEQVNSIDTPFNSRLLCHIIYPYLKDIQPFSQEKYQPIIREKYQLT